MTGRGIKRAPQEDAPARRVLITGACGGLGHAVAEAFAARGAYVYAADLHPASFVREGIQYVPMDVTSAESVASAFRVISASAPALDAVVHFAGIYTMDSLVEIEEATLQRIMDVNFMGVYRVNRAFLPLLMQGRGRILITTSELAGQKPLPFNGVYSISKTALQCYADSLRCELALLGVPVVNLRPGAFRTAMVGESESAMRRMMEKTRLYPDNAQKFERIMRTQTGFAHDPEILARCAWRALIARHPRAEITVRPGVLLKMYDLLPKTVQPVALKWLLSASRT